MSQIPRRLRRPATLARVQMEFPEGMAESLESLGCLDHLAKSVEDVADELAEIKDLLYKETLT